MASIVSTLAVFILKTIFIFRRILDYECPKGKFKIPESIRARLLRSGFIPLTQDALCASLRLGGA